MQKELAKGIGQGGMQYGQIYMSSLKVYHLPGGWGLSSVSPFCLKLDAFLRLTNIPHQSITAATPFGGPYKKAPWIEYDGHKMGDSTLIIDFLTDEFNVDPDAHLSGYQRALGVSIQRLLEENLYWTMVYDRWCRDENWPILKSSVLGDIPVPIRTLLAPYARRAVRKQLAGHGMGLHSPDEINAIAAKDIGALADLLGAEPWYFGDQVSMTDAAVYSLLANILYVQFESPMKLVIGGHSNLVEWLGRFREQVYPELSVESPVG